MSFASLRRCLRVVTPALNTAPAISTLSSNKSTIANDNTEVATFTVSARDNNGAVLVGATVVVTVTGTGNTATTPAVTDASGLTTFTVKSSAAATKTVSVTINGIAVTQTVSLVVSGAALPADPATSTITLQAASAAAGDPAITATLRAKDSGGTVLTVGGATVVATKTGGTSVITQSAVTDNNNGTYTWTITPTTAGTAVTIGATIGGVGTTSTASFTVNAAATYAAGDILDNFGFENVWTAAGKNAFVNGSASTPAGAGSSTIAFDTTQFYAGTYSLKRVMPAGVGTDEAPSIFCPFGRPSTSPWNMPSNPGNQNGATGVNRLYSRFWFKIDAVFNGILKFQINEDYSIGSYQFGGFYFSSSQLRWVFASEWNSQFHTLASLSSLNDGAWHSLECDYYRIGDVGGNVITTGDGEPSVQIWLDNAIITPGTPPSPGYWKNNRLYAGQRGNSVKLGTWNLLGVLNGGSNTVAGNVWVDRVSISTTGRVGP